MNEDQPIQLSEQDTNSLPEKLQVFLRKITEAEYKIMTNELEGLDYDHLSEKFECDIRDFSYGFLCFLFPDGSEDQKVANVLREKREEFLKAHPDQVISKNASKGIIAYDGRFVPQDVWDKMTLAQKFNDLVGSTCFHYNTNVPGYGE